VKVPVYVVPHGVDEGWLNTRVSVNFFKPLLDFKAKRNLKLIQTWLLHSSYRKGEDIVYRVFNELVKERKDAALVVKRPLTLDVYVDGVDEAQLKPTYSLPASWLSDDQIRELMDVCDIFLLGSRGGGFEHPPLLALARGEVALGAKGGAWEDYLPEWALIPSHASDIVLRDNPIHNGRGVEMDVDACVSKLHDILNDLDEYRARVKQHVDTCVKQRFVWSKIGEQLKDITLNVR
jgi:glycosyltransferase involved in cell wall biosynthesis